jgi:hypothetical protein
MGDISLPAEVSPELVAASMSTSSWNCFNSALNCAKSYSQLSWPMSEKFLRGFTNWALTVKKLSPQTVNIYLSDLKLAHKLRGLNSNQFNDFFLKSMTKGAERLSLYSNICKSTKLVLTYPLLRLLGNEVARSNWSEDSKRTFWTACCLAYFGSFRLGEIISPGGAECSQETLTWEKIQIFDNHAVIHIPVPKSIRSKRGDFVDIFPFPDCCPFEALKGLKANKASFVKQNMPVFTFNNGEFLTATKLIATLRILLEKHVGKDVKFLSGHSFRAGIPTALSDCPNIASDEDIRKWGRWNSNSYLLYTRLKLNARRAIFVKIMSAINSRHA